jgi:hypothetical protein
MSPQKWRVISSACKSRIYEAMKIIEEIRDSPELMKAVDRSDHFTKGFAALLAFIGKSASRPRRRHFKRGRLHLHRWRRRVILCIGRRLLKSSLRHRQRTPALMIARNAGRAIK